jgi:hypothetical protein
LLAGAEQANRGWAKDEAFRLYREALTLVPQADAERRRDITRRQAVAYASIVHMMDAELLARRAPKSESEAG